MIQVSGTCRIRPAKKGKAFPPGFRKEALYVFVSIFTPNGSSDLHALVLDDQGSFVPIPINRIQVIELLSPIKREPSG